MEPSVLVLGTGMAKEITSRGGGLPGLKLNPGLILAGPAGHGDLQTAGMPPACEPLALAMA